VYIKAQFLISRPDNRVEYETWYASILDMAYDQLYDIGLFQKALS
jgi:hypothetical protein